MVCIEGKVAFGGIAIGPLREMVKKSKVVRRVRIENTEAEKARFERARTKAQEQLSLLYEKAVKEGRAGKSGQI